jgi:hypothetical protein
MSMSLSRFHPLIAKWFQQQVGQPTDVQAQAWPSIQLGAASHDTKLSASDPLNLVGVILPGPRVPAVPSNYVVIKDGAIVRTVIGRGGDAQRIEQAQVAR